MITLFGPIIQSIWASLIACQIAACMASLL
jgi:hypothetical protein